VKHRYHLSETWAVSADPAGDYPEKAASGKPLTQGGAERVKGL
jgi:hypothetical protein